MKTRLMILILFACATLAQAQYPVASEFVLPSESYYQQEIRPALSPAQDEVSFLDTWAIGGGEGMDSGDDISGNDKSNHANDVPLSDGVLPLIALVSLYLLVKYRLRITHNRSQITHNNK